MEFGQIVAPTIKELFIERIEGMIFSGALKPGDRLPSERDLAEQMKISKTIVHLGLEDQMCIRDSLHGGALSPAHGQRHGHSGKAAALLRRLRPAGGGRRQAVP